jgi:hypothetical protein
MLLMVTVRIQVVSAQHGEAGFVLCRLCIRVHGVVDAQSLQALLG